MSPPAKPPHGDPCNGCGVCCQREVCPLGVLVLGVKPQAVPCPALTSDGDKLVCGLVVAPAKYAPVRTFVEGADAMRDAALLLIGTDARGCDCVLPGEPENIQWREGWKRKRAMIRRSRVGRALKVWGVE